MPDNTRQSVFVADTREIVNTTLKRAKDIRYAMDVELAKRNRDNYFALERMDTSVPDVTRSYIGQAYKAVKSRGADMALTLLRWAKGSYEELTKTWAQANENALAAQGFAFNVQAAQHGGMSQEDINRQAARFSQENDALNRRYENLRKLGRDAMDVMQKNHEAFLSSAGLVKDDQDGFVFDIFDGATTLVGALAVSAITRSPSAAAALFGAYAGRQDYEEALANGLSPKRALAVGIAGGAAEGLLEKVGLDFLDQVFKGKGIWRAGLKGFITEGSQEGLQQSAEEIIMQNFAGREKELEDTFADIAYSAALGGLIGAPVSMVMNVATQEFKKKGADEKTAQTLAKLAINHATSPQVQQEAHDMLQNATSALNYPNGDVLQGAKEFAEVVKQVKNPDRKTLREIYNVAERTEEAARAAGYDADSAELIGKLEQSRANSIFNLAGLKPGSQFDLTKVQFVPLSQTQQTQEQPQTKQQADQEQWEKEYRAHQEQKRKIEQQNEDLFEKHLAAAGLSEKDFFFQENIYKHGHADTNTSAFQKWFGKSQVTDENGNPKVLYRTTENENGANLPEGIYLSAPRIANDYSRGGSASRVIDVYVKMENPLIIEAAGKKFNDFYDTLKEKAKLAEENNHDGVIVKNIRGKENDADVADMYMVFDPKNVKSVRNKGTFSADTSNIYYQERIYPKEITEIHNQVTGEAIPLEMNPDLQKQTPQVLRFARLTDRVSNRKDYKKQVFGDRKNITIVNQNSNDEVVLSSTSAKKIYSTAIRATNEFIKKNHVPSGETQQLYSDALTIAVNIKPIFENAVYILQHDDIMGLDRKIKRYAAEVRVGDTAYFVLATVKSGGTFSSLQLYNLESEQQKALRVISGKTRHPQGNNSIAELTAFVKGKIAKYNKNNSYLPSDNELLQENLFNMQLGLFDAEQTLQETQVKAEEEKSATQEESELKEAANGLFSEEELKSDLPDFKPQVKPERIEDFGEKIYGARKDLWGKYAEMMTRELPADIKEITLSKYFPEPNYEAAIEKGITVEQLAIVKALRDSIPVKPQYPSRAARWVEGLKAARATANQVLNNPEMVQEFKRLNTVLEKSGNLDSVHGKIDFYLSLGYPAFTKAKHYDLRSYRSRYFNGTHYEEPVRIYELTRGYRTVFGSLNKEEVVDYSRNLLTQSAAPTKAPSSLDIYQRLRTGEIIIGKKIASGKFVDLKGGFTRVADAQAYLDENQAHLQALLEEKKRIYPVRGEEETPRVGKEYRPAGTVVTPERFTQEFGFRGVQFGNWVEQGRRAEDLNKAYDALLDMADLIKIPARAVSLDGTLGLAFGARGHSGANAHYESDQVVINLTKAKGAGSLGHEWWHALDNYLGRSASPSTFVSENPRRTALSLRDELRQAYIMLVQEVERIIEPRSRNMDQMRAKDYWSTREEMTARAFESYLIWKGKKQGYSNSYLANVKPAKDYLGNPNTYPYPLDSEMPAIEAAFDNFFNTLKTEQTPRGYTLYEENLEDKADKNVRPDVLGKVTFDIDNNKAIIQAARQANKSTALHEFYHVWERDLFRAEKVSHEEDFLQLVQDLRNIHAQSADFVKNYLSKTQLLSEPQRQLILDNIAQRGGDEYIKKLAFDDTLDATDTTANFVRRGFRENFATLAEKYFMNGKAPNAAYKSLFERFAQWLRDIYGALTGAEISPQVQKFFDRLMVREGKRVDSKLFTGKVDKIRQQINNIRQGSPNGEFTLEQIKALAGVLDAPAPRLPSSHLLKDLRRYGAEYANAARIDKEAYKNARVFNKEGGVGDSPARWLQEKGYLVPQNAATYEELDALNEQAYDMIQRALDGEIIYPIGSEQQVAEYENYKELIDTIREVWGSPAEAKKTIKAILALEEKGYRVVEKKDLNALSLRLGELNKLADRLDNKSEVVRNKESADKSVLYAARKIKRQTIEELEKRQLAGKQDIIKKLREARSFEQIQEATAQALDLMEQAYQQTEQGLEEKRRLDIPTTNWDKVHAQLLRAYNQSVGTVDSAVKEAWRVRTLSTTGDIRRLENWSEKELARRQQQAEKVLKEAEPKLEAAFMRAAEQVLRGIGGIESDDIRRIIVKYAKSATRRRALYKSDLESLLKQAKSLQEDNYKKYVNKKIHEVLSLNLFDKRGNLRKAMVDPKTLNALSELKRVARLTPEQAAEELSNRMNYFTDNPATPTDKIVNELLSLQAYDRKDISMQLFKQTYDDIYALRKAGRSARNLQKMIMDFRTEQDKSEVLAAVEKNKKAGLVKRMYASWLANWESFLDLITNKDIKEKYSMLNLEADTLTYTWSRRTAIMDGVKRIYGLKSNREVQNKMNELRNEKHTFINYALEDQNVDINALKHTGKAFEEELSKMQILTAYIYAKNDNLLGRLLMQYKGQLPAMWKMLDAQDLALADFLQKEAEKSYAQINEVFVKERGYDLPRVENYFPSVTERVESELDFLQGAVNMSKNPSFIKARSKSELIQMKLENPFGILFRHIDRAADYHFKAEKLNQIRRVFKSPVIKPAIIERVGEDVYKRMLELIDQFSVTKPRLNYDMDRLGDWLTNNYVKGAIALKPTIAIKQLISAMNYAENMPTAKWIGGFTEAVQHPKETVRFMMEGDPYLKARFESGSMNEALARATADANAITARGKFLRFTDLLTINTRLGDMGAIIFGGKPYVNYLMKEKGLSEKEAFAEFRKATLRSQQANTRSSLSTLQARDMNFLVRGLFAFKNTPAQYARKIADAINEYQRGEISATQLGKVVAIYGLFNSWFYSTLTSLGLLAWFYDNDDADEIIADELFFSPFVQMAGCLPVLDMAVGAAAEVVKAKAFDHRPRLERPELPVISDLFALGQRALKEELSAEDVLDMLATSGQLLGGLPTRYAKGLYSGIEDIASGENAMRGFLQALGYTENRSHIATNTKE